jgi:hypothetical protein
MFDSITRNEPVSFRKLGLVAVVAGAVLGAEAAGFVAVVARPLADFIAGVRAPPPRTPARDDLPDFGEEIAVTAPYRVQRATVQARGVPWRNPDPVIPATLDGYCPVQR